MSVTHTPSAADALFHGFSGRSYDDPLAYSAASGKRIDAKFFLKPLQDEVLNLIGIAAAGGGALIVRNQSGAALSAGPVRITGHSASEAAFLIAAADASGAAPAHFLLLNALANNTSGIAFIGGAMPAALNTSASSVGSPVYLAAGGGMTLTAPGGADQIAQEVGRVKTVSASGDVQGLVRAPSALGSSWLQNLAVSTGKLADAAVTVQKMALTLGALDLGSEISITGAATATIQRAHIVTGTTADYTITLPAASGNAGKLIAFRFGSALTKVITLDGSGSETISGKAARKHVKNEAVILLCDGSNWHIAAQWLLPVKCKAYMQNGGAGKSISAATFTKVPFDTEVIDSNSNFDSSAGSHQFTATVPGDYLVTASIGFSGASVPQRYLAKLDKNGSYIANFFDNNLGAGGNFVGSAASVVYNVAAGDVLSVYVYSDKAGTIDFTEANTNIVIERILTNE
jgi:hypothetical protein